MTPNTPSTPPDFEKQFEEWWNKEQYALCANVGSSLLIERVKQNVKSAALHFASLYEAKGREAGLREAAEISQNAKHISPTDRIGYVEHAANKAADLITTNILKAIEQSIAVEK